MKRNQYLRKKVKELVLPLAESLNNGDVLEVDIATSMEIENGESINGYQYLHGTNKNVGGFTIVGTISKNAKGDVKYDLTYTWNDIIDPNFSYESDREKYEFAKRIASPADYVLKIIWTDKTTIYSKESLFKKNKGWLAK